MRFGLALALTFLLPQSEPLEVIARIPPGSYVAGQAIEIRLGVVAEGERPHVTPPSMPASRADLILIDRDFRQVGVSGIGEMVRESNLYIERYLVIPKRPGPLDVPPFLAALGDRRGASRPLRIEVLAIPGGRPATFLGGVGGLALRAGLSADRVRVGGTIEYSLTLDGPGSRASSDRPTLEHARSRNPSLEITPTRDDLIQDPPARTLRWSLRPTTPGEHTMPPVLVSTYNPRTRQFDTRSSPGVNFLVADVPRFDESRFRYGPTPDSEPLEEDREVEVVERPALLGVLGLVGASGAILVARRIHRSRRPMERARRLASRGLAEIGRTDPEHLPGWTIRLVESLVALEPGGPGNVGTLDPRRVRSALRSVGLPAPIIRGVDDLWASCEAVAYGEKGQAGPLREHAGRVLREIAACRPDRGDSPTDPTSAP